MADGFTIRFRSKLTRADWEVLQSSLGFSAFGDFHDYFNPYRGGEARGAKVAHGAITLWFCAAGDPPDVYVIEAVVGEQADADGIAMLEARAREVVSRIADLEYRHPATLYFLVRHIGLSGQLERPGGTLYRLCCGEPITLERYVPQGGAKVGGRPTGWVSKPDDLFWIMGARLGDLEVGEADAVRIEAELDRERTADAREELYTPRFP